VDTGHDLFITSHDPLKMVTDTFEGSVLLLYMLLACLVQLVNWSVIGPTILKHWPKNVTRRSVGVAKYSGESIWIAIVLIFVIVSPV